MRSLVEFYELVVGSTKAEGFGVHNINREVIGPAIIFDKPLMLLGGVASAFVGGVALDDSAVDMFDDRAHKFWMEVGLILVWLFFRYELS